MKETQWNFDKYKKDLEVHVEKLQAALGKHSQIQSSGEKNYLKAVMDRELDLIEVVVREIEKRGVKKQEVKIHKSYLEYCKNPSNESLNRLQHDLITFRGLIKDFF